MSDAPIALGSRPALVLIDLQKEMLRERMVHDVDAVLAAAAALLQAFQAHSLPVVLTAWDRPGSTGGADPDRFAPELTLRGDERLVARSAFSAFAGTGVLDDLRSHGVDRLVLAGVATSIGIESSIRDAADHGFRPLVVRDATTDLTIDAHEWTFTHVLPIFGTATTSDALIAALTG
jgi:nicotinamidase-related amidase